MKVQIEIPAEFADLCEECKVKPQDVLKGFMADLCSLDGSNGSDERNLADQYFERVGYFWRNK